jgi:hypothetical protein
MGLPAIHMESRDRAAPHLPAFSHLAPQLVVDGFERALDLSHVNVHGLRLFA